MIWKLWNYLSCHIFQVQDYRLFVKNTLILSLNNRTISNPFGRLRCWIALYLSFRKCQLQCYDMNDISHTDYGSPDYGSPENQAKQNKTKNQITFSILEVIEKSWNQVIPQLSYHVESDDDSPRSHIILESWKESYILPHVIYLLSLVMKRSLSLQD